MKKMKRNERIIIVILLVISLIALLFFKFNKSASRKVSVKDADNNILLSFDLYEDNIYEIKGKYGVFHIEVKDGKCRAIDVDCPNQICVHTGWISENNPLPIVCIPNGIMVLIDE